MPSVAVTVSNGTLSLSPLDTSLRLDTTNYSTDTQLTTYTWPDNKVANAILMEFDLSSLPADAKLYVDNVLCTLTSSQRSFATPKLAPGQKYYYTLRVELSQNGQTMSRSQQVTLQAGQHVQVNFNPAGVFTTKN